MRVRLDDQATQPMQRMGRQAEETTRDMRGLSAKPWTVSIKDAATAPMRAISRTLATLAKPITIPIKVASGAAGMVKGAIGAVGGALGGVGLAAMGAGAIKDLATGAADFVGLGLANEMEQTTAKFNAFTKSAELSAELIEKVRVEAAKTPFQFGEMATSAAALYPVMKQTGKSFDDVINLAEILAASNPAQGLEGAAFALREAASGDFTSVIERFNLSRSTINKLKEQGVPALDAVRKAMEEMGYDSQLVSAKAETMEGRWSTFLDTFDEVRRSIATPIFDALKEALLEASDALDDMLPALKDMASWLGQKIAGAIRVVTRTIGPLITTLQALATAFTKDAGAMGIVYDMIRKVFGEKAANAVQPFLQKVMDLIPRLREIASLIAGKVLGAVTSVWNIIKMMATGDFEGGIFGLDEDHPLIGFFLTLREKAIDAWGWITDTGAPAVKGALDSLGKFIESDVVPALGRLKGYIDENVVPALQRFYDWLTPKLQSALDWLRNEGLPGAGKAADDFATSLGRATDAMTGMQAVRPGSFLDSWNLSLQALANTAQHMLGIFESLGRIIGVLFPQQVGQESTQGVNLLTEVLDGMGRQLLQTAQDIETFAAALDAALKWLADFLEANRDTVQKLMALWQESGDNMLVFMVKLGTEIVNSLMQGMAAGLQSLKDWISTNIVAAIPEQIRSLMGLAHDTGAMAMVGQRMVEEIIIGLNAKKGALLSAIGGLGASAMGAAGSFFTGGGDVDAWLTAAIQATGVPASWLAGLRIIAMNESGGNPNAMNDWDVNAAAGDPSKGLMQTIGATFNAYKQAGHDNILNPVDNAIAAINYIKARYGDISSVPGVASVSAGGAYKPYDAGGWLPPGRSLVENLTGAPEPVLTPSQFGALAGGGRTIVVDVGGLTLNVPGGGDAQGLAAALPSLADQLAGLLAPRLRQALDNMGA